MTPVKKNGVDYDVMIIGAGIAGMETAALLVCHVRMVPEAGSAPAPAAWKAAMHLSTPLGQIGGPEGARSLHRIPARDSRRYGTCRPLVEATELASAQSRCERDSPLWNMRPQEIGGEWRDLRPHGLRARQVPF